jgi:hypothetical protein
MKISRRTKKELFKNKVLSFDGEELERSVCVIVVSHKKASTFVGIKKVHVVVVAARAGVVVDKHACMNE